MSTMSQGIYMYSPASEAWWSAFHNEHGKDSEEEKAFLGFLTTKGIPGGSGPDVLAQAYTDFLAFVEASYGQASAVETEGDVRDREMREREGPPPVPRSSLAAPTLQKPMTAATRPPDLREKDAASQPSPLTSPEAATPSPAPAETPSAEAHRREEDGSGRRGRP